MLLELVHGEEGSAAREHLMAYGSLVVALLGLLVVILSLVYQNR